MFKTGWILEMLKILLPFFRKQEKKSALSGFIKHCLHILDSTPDELKNNIFNTFEQNLI